MRVGSSSSGLVGPLFAWPLLDTPYIRRRGTLAIGAALSMAFLFGFTQVTNATQNLVISCFITAVQSKSLPGFNSRPDDQISSMGRCMVPPPSSSPLGREEQGTVWQWD
jgi:hypothetical protein